MSFWIQHSLAESSKALINCFKIDTDSADSSDAILCIESTVVCINYFYH